MLDALASSHFAGVEVKSPHYSPRQFTMTTSRGCGEIDARDGDGSPKRVNRNQPNTRNDFALVVPARYLIHS